MNWLLHFIGVRPRVPDGMYNFWSGFGSDLAEFALFGGVWKLLNCHEEGCMRLGTRITMEDNGRHYRRCHKHNHERHFPEHRPEYNVKADPNE